LIALDTHALVWWVSGGPLSEPAAEAIERASVSHSLFASSITVWEVAMLVEKGRLELTVDVTEWIERVEAMPQLRFLPVDNRIAIASTRLPGFVHADPADRIIVATARSIDAALVTRDKRLQEYSALETIW
jgi:PIN domain nuclease of toxin-antitoxin system